MLRFCGIVALSAAGVGLTGCSHDPRSVQAAVREDLPSDFKAIIVQKAKDEFKDPYSIKSAEISDPFAYAFGVAVCVRANAKNAFGGYTGIHPTGYVFARKQYLESGESTIICNGATSYKPFPELEHIT